MAQSGGHTSLLKMLTEVAGHFRHGVDSQPGFKAHATALMNRALEMAADTQDWPDLRRNSDLRLTVQGDADTDTVKSGSSYFVAPWGCARVDSVTMMTPTRYAMSEVSPEQLLTLIASADAESVGQPRYFAEWGTTAQHAALAAEGGLTLLSDSNMNSSDEANLRAVVSYRPAGHHLGQTVTVNVEGDFGSGVALPLDAVAGWPIESVEVPAGWAGSLTIEDASANVIVDVPKWVAPTSTASGGAFSYRRTLFRTEKASDVDRGGNIAWLSDPRRLTSDSDVPDIPCATFLIEMTVAMLYAARGNVVMDRTHRSNAYEALGDKLARKKKAHKAAGPMFGNLLGMSGMGDF